MPTVTIRYRLPEEQAEYDAARTGADARAAIADIDRRLRELCKYGNPTAQERMLAVEIRGMIHPELLE